MACAYWNEKFNVATQMYECPWCQRELKAKMSMSAKNPNRVFVSCNKDFGGCGLFSFVDDQPNESFNPNKKQGGQGQKRAKTEGTNIVGPVVNQPAVHEQRLAELAAEVSGLKSMIVEVLNYLQQ
jgi:hypothetical protein